MKRGLSHSVVSESQDLEEKKVALEEKHKRPAHI